jgi:precorrin-3B synthase
MTAAPQVKGWCPTLLSPMQSGDGWLVRVKPRAATLSANDARLIADAAAAHGNRHIDLTSRANLQVRGLTPQSAELFAGIMIAAGLASPDPTAEAVRNVMASPLGADDPSAAFDAHAAARGIEAMLGAEAELTALPDKFCILIDAGGMLALSGIAADISVTPAEGGMVEVRLDGGARGASCSLADLPASLRALGLASLDLAQQRHEPPARMRTLVGTVGEEAVFAEAGLVTVPMPKLPAGPAKPPVGFMPYPGRDIGMFGAGLPYGRIEATALAALGSLAKRFGDNTLRATPWRTLLIAGVRASDRHALADDVASLGLIADAADSRLRIHACVGAPSCLSASVDARAAADRIAQRLAGTSKETVHISACAKSCAHRGPASLTLVGRDGRYDLIRNGGTADRPSLTGLRLEELLAVIGANEEVTS